MKIFWPSLWLVLLLALFALSGSGCSTTESENQSARPWNAPTSWQNGLPIGINQGR